MNLIEIIDRIREIRAEADKERDTDYDPQGHAMERAARLDAEAKTLEDHMHGQIGWSCKLALEVSDTARDLRVEADHKAWGMK